LSCAVHCSSFFLFLGAQRWWNFLLKLRCLIIAYPAVGCLRKGLYHLVRFDRAYPINSAVIIRRFPHFISPPLLFPFGWLDLFFKNPPDLESFVPVCPRPMRLNKCYPCRSPLFKTGRLLDFFLSPLSPPEGFFVF